tara:strand:+ start:570 stop:1745 length:1176 start_codon:yes stop_codon:yes gene_type:complete
MNLINLEKPTLQNLSTFADHFNTYNNLWKSTSLTFTNKPFSNIDFENIPDYQLYNEEIKSCIKEMNKLCFTTHFIVKDRQITLRIVVNKNKDNIQEYLQSVLKKVFIWLHTVSHYADDECSKQLTIHLFMSQSIKLLPNKEQEYLSEGNANSAFTFTCRVNNNIHIFREEEWFKVFIHETFHNFNLDFSKYDNSYSDHFIKQLFLINTDFRLYESYCEFWATILNCVYYANDKAVAKTNISFKNTLRNCINNEIQHSLFQCVKILNYYGMKYQDLYENNSQASFARTYKYKENTPILSYFVIKTVLLFHYNSFISWCNNNNNPFLRFSSNTTNIKEKMENYTNVIKNIYKSDLFIENIDKHHKDFQTKKEKLNINNIFLLKTLRMTITDTQ